MMTSNRYITYSFLSIILIFLLSTNSYFNFNESLIYGAADGFSYFEISKFAPKFSSTPIQPIHAERFFFPYLIGITSKILFIETYLLYRMLSVFLIILINIYFIEIFLKFKKNIYIVLISLLVINMNPYLTRFYIANPLIINDLIFIYGSLLSISGVESNDKKKFFIGLIISSLARQSAAAIILSIVACKLIQKKKFFINHIELISAILIFILIYFLGYFYSSSIPVPVSRSEQYLYTIFGLFIENKPIIELVIFFIWPFLSYGPLLLYFFMLMNKNEINFSKNININYFLVFFILLIIMQPILQGVYVSGKNIIRLTTLAYPALLFCFLINIKSNDISKLKFYILFFLFLTWSSHPTFSMFNFLEKFKF